MGDYEEKMRVAFFHDARVSKDKNGNYYNPAINEMWLSRYLGWADSIELCLRKGNEEKWIREEYLVPMTNVEIMRCENISSIGGIFKMENVKKKIRTVLENCDGAVIRLPSRIGQRAVEYCEALGKPYLVELVACPWDSYWNHSLKGKLVALPYTIQTKKAVRKASAVIYVTNMFLQERYPTAGMQLACSDVELQDLTSEILEKRIAKINRNEKKIILGTTAVIDVKYKGQQYVIKALGELKKRGMDNYEYQLVGGGDNSYLKELAKKYNIEEQVKFLGVYPHKQVFTWLDSIDIYIQPSRVEGLPRALVEALSRGLPAIGAKAGGIPELIEKEFIFSNSKKNIEEIINILTNISIEKMEAAARRNYDTAQKYEKERLRAIRKKFYQEYFLMNKHKS